MVISLTSLIPGLQAGKEQAMVDWLTDGQLTFVALRAGVSTTLARFDRGEDRGSGDAR